MFDNYLELAKFKLIDLKWKEFDLLPDDKDHFTWYGYTVFCEHLSNTLFNMGIDAVHIFSDSTIDYWNDCSSCKSGCEADLYLINELAKKNIFSTVDAWCGSGFVAPSNDPRGKFYHRLSMHARNHSFRKNATVLFIGGWNDLPFQDEQVEKEIQRVSSFVELVQSGMGPRFVKRPKI
jgi:hypothetical protein